jgi:4'-phosphopantetheinyl transferase
MSLLNNAVHTFQMRVTDDLSHVQRVGSHLTQQERDRAARFTRTPDRIHFLLAHGLLRHALNTVAGPRLWVFRNSAHGKPEIALPAADGSPLHFNLSHTEGLAVCAVGRNVEIGIDAEKIRSDIDVMELANRFFSQRDVALLHEVTGDERCCRFYRLWTFKEAVAKATGLGLAMPLDQFWFTLSPLTVGFAPGMGETATDWKIVERANGNSHRMALALRRVREFPADIIWHETTIEDVAAGLSDVPA